jgi:putative ABC transport system permease protein
VEVDYWAKNTPIGFIFSLGTLIGFIVGVVIVYQILSSDVADHLAEYATLKAMGYNDVYMLQVVFQEALNLAILGFLPGSAIAIGFYALTRNATTLPLVMTVDRAATVLILTIIMCLLSGAVATRKLRLADPADIF